MNKCVGAVIVGIGITASLLLSGGCYNVQAKLQEAVAAAQTGNWTLGYEITEKCLKKEPANVSAMVLNGICLHYVDRDADAATILEQAATGAPENFEAQYFYGWVLASQQRYADALVPLRRAYQLKPDHEQLLVLLSRCCVEQNLAEGVQYLKALRRFPQWEKSAELYNALGMLWLNQGQYNAAKNFFLLAWQRDNANLSVPQNLAVLHDQFMKKPADALRYYRFCLVANQKGGSQFRAAQINDRILELAKELPKTPPPPVKKSTAPVPGAKKAVSAAPSTKKATPATGAKKAAPVTAKKSGTAAKAASGTHR